MSDPRWFMSRIFYDRNALGFEMEMKVVSITVNDDQRIFSVRHHQLELCENNILEIQSLLQAIGLT